MNDDFCGCENTLTPCEKIKQSYFKNVNFSDMKNEYFKGTVVFNKLSKKGKNDMIRKLPSNYP